MTSYLNTENIARKRGGVEYHPLRPFLPENARVLFLGRDDADLAAHVVSDEFDEVIAKVGDVKGFEFLEDLRGEDVVNAFKLGAAGRDIAWDESV